MEIINWLHVGEVLYFPASINVSCLVIFFFKYHFLLCIKSGLASSQPPFRFFFNSTSCSFCHPGTFSVMTQRPADLARQKGNPILFQEGPNAGVFYIFHKGSGYILSLSKNWCLYNGGKAIVQSFYCLWKKIQVAQINETSLTWLVFIDLFLFWTHGNSVWIHTRYKNNLCIYNIIHVSSVYILTYFYRYRTTIWRSRHRGSLITAIFDRTGLSLPSCLQSRGQHLWFCMNPRSGREPCLGKPL